MVQKQRPQNKRERYVIDVGPLMKRVLDEQIASAKEVTYDVVKVSYYEAAEIVAKKILGLV